MKKYLALILTLVMVFALFAGCSPAETPPEDGTPTPTPEAGAPAPVEGTINVAFIGNTTGDSAQYGIAVKNGMMIYIDELNAAGGINGKQVNILPYDDKGDPLESVNSYNKAKGEDITAVIGAVLTAPTMTLVDATYEDNMPQISASATAAGVTQIDPTDPESEIRTNVFRSCFIDPFAGEKMADYAANKLSAKTAAIFYESGSDYSEGLTASFEAKAEELGLEIISTEAFATGDKDFNAQMTSISALAPDVIFMPFYYANAGLAITQARQAGFEGTVLGADGFGGIKDFASAEDLEGTVYCSGYAPGTDTVLDFEAAYEAAYGETVPNMFAPLAYDAAMLMCNALAAAEEAGLEAGSDEYKQAVIDHLAANDGTEGITGSYTFDKYNNPVKTAAMLQLQSGEEVFTELY